MEGKGEAWEGRGGRKGEVDGSEGRARQVIDMEKQKKNLQIYQ
jgi:hypothetical protein